MDLAGNWDALAQWHQTSGTVALPGSFKSILGLRRSFDLPESWVGKRVRLVVEMNTPNAMNGLIVNSTGYCRVSQETSEGGRLKQSTKPTPFDGLTT